MRLFFALQQSNYWDFSANFFVWKIVIQKKNYNEAKNVVLTKDRRLRTTMTYFTPQRPPTARKTAFIARLCLAFLTLFMVIFPMASQATEEPDFKTVDQRSGFDVRDYPGYTVAEVVVEGPADKAGSQAFPLLAGYIFGKNRGERKLAMTAPVTQTPEPVKMAMTAPVTQVAAPGGFVVQFVLPKEVTLANAPEPLDARIKLRAVPPSRVAVLRYSGFWSDDNYQKHLLLLQASLKQADLAWEGEAVYSRYDPPFMPWFLRRNEIWLHLAKPWK